MTQAALVILALKAGCLAAFLSLTGWVALYTRYAKWWRSEIGRTLVIKTLLVALLLVPTALSLFFKFSRTTSYAAAWADAALIWLITPVMIWRSAVWHKIHKKGEGP